MSAIDELLPCAFCGARLERKDIFSSRAQTTYVHPESSPTCFAEGTLISTRDPERIAAWNRRALALQQAVPMPGVKLTIDDVEQIIIKTEPPGMSDRDDRIWTRRMAVALAAEFNGRILAALATPEAGTSEPVAWMISGKDGKQRWLQWRPTVADADAALVTVRPLYARPAPAQAPVDGEAVRALLSRLIYPVDTSINPRGWELREEPMIEEAVRYIQEALAAAPSARKEP